MNKKLFILLPAALLALTGCQNSNGGSGAPSGDESSDAGSGTSGGGETSGTDSTGDHYGTPDDPYSVAEALELAADLAIGSATDKRVYIGGVVDTRPTVSSYGWGNFNMADARGGSQLLVWSVNKVEGITTVYQNDAIVLEGFIKNHEGTLEVTNIESGVGYPTMVSRSAGVSPIVLGAHEHAVVTNLQDSLGNGTGCNFNVAPDSGYQIDRVKLNGEVLEGNNGLYSFTVTGDALITVEASEEGALVEKLAYKLDGTVTQTNEQPYNAYAMVSEVTQEGVAWDVLANTAQNPWRFGGKSITNEKRDAKSNVAVSTQNICKVEVDLGDIFTGCTFNSLSVYVGTTKGAKDVSELTVATPAQQTKVAFVRPEGKDWSSKYFTIVFDVTVSGTSNKCVQMKAANFYYMG